jgi:rhodanese-related sulfurtransferase
MKLLKVSLLFITTIYQSSLIAEDICPKEPQDKTNSISKCGEEKEVTSINELKNLLERKEVLLIDVRSKEEFERAHIKGAISIPIGDKPELILKDIAPNCNQRIVVYCENQINYRSRMVSLSRLGSISFKSLGYQNVSELENLFHKEISGKLQIEGNNIRSSILFNYSE